MAKSKKKTKSPGKEKKTHKGKNNSGAIGKQVSAVMTGTMVAEIVESAVDRLIQKVSDSKILNSSRGNDSHGNSNPIKNASSSLRDHLENVGSTVNDTVEAAKSTAYELTPALTDVVDALKERSQRSLQQSTNAVGDTTEGAVKEVVDTAKNVMGVINPSKPDKRSIKSKKKGKKKHKK